MKYLLKFSKFESISGTELVGPMGPGYGDVDPSSSIYNIDGVIWCDLDEKWYGIKEYTELYNQYLSSGGKPLFGFNKENINFCLSKFNLKDN